MRERDIERRLGIALQKQGCLFYKFVSPGSPGVPDRIVVTTDGRTFYVELKTERGHLSQQQCAQIARLRQNGAEVRVLYGLKQCMDFAKEIGGKDNAV